MVKVKILPTRRPAKVPNLWFLFLFIVSGGILTIFNYKIFISNMWRTVGDIANESPFKRILIDKDNKDVRHLWFMKNGFLYPSPTDEEAKLLPEQAPGDRIFDQLMYVPASVNSRTPLKTVLPHYFGRWYGLPEGTKEFENCPVTRCIIVYNFSYIYAADVAVFNQMMPMKGDKPKGQLWVGLNLESPRFSSSLKDSDPLNWTANVRSDSDIVSPYAKWMYYDPEIRQLPQKKNYALNKTKLVAWMVSNCAHANNSRLQYAKELSKYIQVDIYGKCGTLECPRTDEETCARMLRTDYKFYLAFENSNCREYITEKFFLKCLQNDVVPIAMGAFPEDYKKLAPENSYIHVNDFAGPKELAEYLMKVAADDTLYNSYFLWKGTGEFIATNFWCRLCTMLHSNLPQKYYENYDKWWISPEACV